MIAPNAVSATICSWREEPGKIGVHLVGDAVCVAAHLAAVLHDHAFLVAQPQGIRVLARLDQQATEERRADEAVGLRGNGMGEEMSEPLPQERLDRVPKRIPRHQGIERRQRPEQGSLHVGDAADVLLVVVVRGPGRGRSVLVVERRDTSHGGVLEAVERRRTATPVL